MRSWSKDHVKRGVSQAYANYCRSRRLVNRHEFCYKY